MNVKKRVGVLSVCLIIALLTACGGGKNAAPSASNTDSGSSPSQTASASGDEHAQWLAKQKEKWHIGDNLTVDWYYNESNFNFKKWTDYPVLRDVSEITGVTPNLIVPSGDSNQKLNTMIATGDLPDMITMVASDPLVEKMIKQGLVYSYDELSQKYAPEFMNEIPKDMYNFIKSDVDGKFYGVVSYFLADYMPKFGSYAYLVRQDLYKQLGSPDISTPDKLVEVLKQFKQKFPKLDGRPSIPINFSQDLWSSGVVESSFGIRNYSVDANQNLHIKYSDPKYVEFIKFMNRLYREGLMDKEQFIKKDAQLQQDWASRVFMSTQNYWYLDTASQALTQNKGPDAKFVAVEPMKTPSFEFPAQGRSGWTITLITKKAKHPDQLIKFVRYMFNKDGNLLMNWGYEGQDYVIEGDSINRTPDAWAATADADRSNEYFKTRGIAQFNLLYFDWFKRGTNPKATEPEKVKNEMIANYIDKYATDWTAISYKIEPEPTTEEGAIATKVYEIAGLAMPRMVLADSEAKAVEMYNKMMSDMKSSGLDQLEKYYTERYKKNIEKFGEDYRLQPK